ncbi:hypothetical protein NFI96_030737 [Prochilodus magdalenae]|nr:hypothetical protein NFI96_030737 [Prochilodus magdalenae]
MKSSHMTPTGPPQDPPQDHHRTTTGPPQSRWTVRDDSSSAAAQCSVGHPLVLHQWTQDTAPQDAAPQDAAPQDAAPQDAAPQDTAPQDAAPQDTAPQDTAPQDAAPQDAAPQDAAPQDAAPQDAAPQDTAPQDAAPQEAAPQDTAPQDPAPQDAAPQEAAPQDAVSWIVLVGGRIPVSSNPPPTSYLLCGGPVGVLPIEEQGNTVHRETDGLQSGPVHLQSVLYESLLLKFSDGDKSYKLHKLHTAYGPPVSTRDQRAWMVWNSGKCRGDALRPPPPSRPENTTPAAQHDDQDEIERE